MSGATIKVYSPKDFPAYLPKLSSLYDDLFTGGKGFRADLVSRISRHLQLPEKTIRLLAQTTEFIHNSSLLHDDLIDGSELRRGKTAAWKKYSPDYAVLAGDYLLARVMVNLSEFGNVQLIQVTAETISDLVEGEWLQDSIMGDYFVSPQQLDRIHNLKTASLFKWCLRSPFIALQIKDEEIHSLLEEMGTILGLLFQRSDDLLDYDIRNLENKAILGDLKSGYLNSFGAFVTAKMAKSDIDKLIRAQTMEQFYSSLGSEQNFSDKVREFDRMNIDLIEVYAHYCNRLAEKSPLVPASLIDDIRPLPDLLYWRKQKPAAAQAEAT